MRQKNIIVKQDYVKQWTLNDYMNQSFLDKDIENNKF